MAFAVMAALFVVGAGVPGAWFTQSRPATVEELSTRFRNVVELVVFHNTEQGGILNGSLYGTAYAVVVSERHQPEIEKDDSVFMFSDYMTYAEKRNDADFLSYAE